MPFRFSFLCELLNRLEIVQVKKRSNRSYYTLAYAHITSWFQEHQHIIPRQGTSAVAFLSSILPDKRRDRIFELRENRLESIIQQAQCLGATRMRILQGWRTRNGVDFPSCVEKVMSQTDPEPRPGPMVSLEEINEVLDRIAALSSFSSPDLRNRINTSHPQQFHTADALSYVFRRLNSSEAKWLTRMILKSYSPVHIPEHTVLQEFHYLMPQLFMIQNSLEAACSYLSETTATSTALLLSEDMNSKRDSSILKMALKPGVMVARRSFALKLEASDTAAI